jgi:flagellar motility protein MotE (MotC chaperone)
MLCFRTGIARRPMLKPIHRSHVLLLLAAYAMAGASPVLALDDGRPSRPPDARPSAQKRIVAGRKPALPVVALPGDNAPSRPASRAAEDTGPLITGAAPAPDNPPSVVRPVRSGSVAAAPKPAAATPSENEIAQFCSNVADPAVDARLAWQLKELEQAENKLRERLAEVEAKRAEYEKWMALRDEFLKKAEASMVEIYSRMRPEAAATHIAGMSDETAAAVLAKLSPRNSSAIFNEMDSARAAHLADLLGGMRRVDDGKTSK